MAWKPDLTVAAIIPDQGRYLFVEERIKRRLVLNQPAGHVEDGETLVSAIVREVAEETAREFVPEYLLGIYLWRDPRSLRTTLRFAFVGTAGKRDATRALDACIVATHWLGRDELIAREARLRSPLVLQCIDDHCSGKRLPIDAVNCSVCASS